jgi:hypothetical protein
MDVVIAVVENGPSIVGQIMAGLADMRMQPMPTQQPQPFPPQPMQPAAPSNVRQFQQPQRPAQAPAPANNAMLPVQLQQLVQQLVSQCAANVSPSDAAESILDYEENNEGVTEFIDNFLQMTAEQIAHMVVMIEPSAVSVLQQPQSKQWIEGLQQELRSLSNDNESIQPRPERNNPTPTSAAAIATDRR